MKKEEKLKKIIEYAVERGWDVKVAKYHIDYLSLEQPLTKAMYYDILFSHDFAEKVFGTGWVCTACGQEVAGQEEGEAGICEHNRSIDGEEKSFEYHLKQAVISKDPREYYYKYVSQKEKISN